MSHEFMRFLESYLGGFVMYALRLFWVPFDWRLRRHRGGRPISTILIQKYFGVGSIINAMPTIAALRALYPDSRIVFCTFERQKPFVELLGVADTVIGVSDKSFFHFFTSIFKTCWRLRRCRADISIDFEFFSRFSMMMAVLSGAPVRVGFYSSMNPRSPLLTHPVPFNHYFHISRCYLSMAEALGAGEPKGDAVISLPRFRDEFRNHLEDLVGDVENESLIVVNSCSSRLCSLRSWPREYYAELLCRLIGSHGECQYVLIGTKEDSNEIDALIEKINAPSGRVLNLAGKTDPRCLLALLEKARLLITNDSGPAHMAAGYGTETIVMFGPETPMLYRPLNLNAHVFYQPPYCSPCLNTRDNKSFKDCNHITCMKDIAVDEVFETAHRILSGERVSRFGKDGTGEATLHVLERPR